MLSVYDDEYVIEEVINHLLSQEIELVVLDNGSSDDTYEICKKFLGKGLLLLSQFKTPTLQLYLRLRMLYEMALTQKPDWVIRSDSDEFLESGIKNLTLKKAISQADAEGYNLIQFDLFDFQLTDNDNESAKSIKEKLTYYSWQGDTVYRAWKYFLGIRPEDAGGHYPIFPERLVYKIYPRKFVARHYCFQSKEQATKKMNDRIARTSDTAELNMGWHPHYREILKYEFPRILDHKILTKYEENNKWNRERKSSICPTNYYVSTKNDIFTEEGKLKINHPSMPELRAELINKDKKISELQKELENLGTKETQYNELQKKVDDLQSSLNKIENSFTWRTLRKFDKFKEKF